MVAHVLAIVQADASVAPDTYNDVWMTDLKLLLSIFIVLNILSFVITAVVMCNVFNRLKKQQEIVTQYGVKIEDLNFIVGHQASTISIVCARIGWTIGSRQAVNPAPTAPTAPTENARDEDAAEAGRCKTRRMVDLFYDEMVFRDICVTCMETRRTQKTSVTIAGV